MKILNPSQIYQADKATIESENIDAITLMERVGELCFNWIASYFDTEITHTFYVFCGVGNNGGDGLVIARYLLNNGYKVKVIVVDFSDKYTPEFSKNLERLEEEHFQPMFLNNSDNFPQIPSNTIVIDALFGLGLKRPIEGFTKDLISHINKSEAFILSIDLPSGLYANQPILEDQIVIKATHTLTFQNPKLCFLLPDNKDYIKSWEVLPIGLNQKYIDELPCTHFLTCIDDAQSIYKKREKFSHKGTYGHSLLIGGSHGKVGAMVLASKAANTIGSGLVSSLVPNCGYTILQTLVPEAMTITSGDDYLLNFNNKIKANALGIGMGMGLEPATQKAFLDFLSKNKSQLVLDADALNGLSLNKKALSLLPNDTILTPHPKELQRLIGKWKNDYEKIEMIKTLSKKHKIIIILKGAYTLIVKNDACYFNTTGNPALATAGSGDVLTGIITGLLAQKYTALQAAILGVYLHGKTADIAIETDLSQESFTALDIIRYLPKAFKNLERI